MSDQIERILSEDGFYVSTTVGMSMFPMLRNRKDRVVIRPLGEEKLKKYDLPLYRRPDGKYVLHRIIGVREGYYVIRGDNTYHKEKVPQKWILGYVTEFYRNEKHITVESKKYRVYARFWNGIYPLRFLAVKCRAGLSKVKHALLKPFRRKKQ